MTELDESSLADGGDSLARPRDLPPWINGVLAGVSLYLFLSAINVMGAGLGTLGEGTEWLQNLLAEADNPFIALMASVLVTAIVQSSSFTTSLIITLVASGDLGLNTAVYAIMGANIGTSVTNLIVSLGNVRIRQQFRRAFTAALVHDVFNWLTVAVLFPVEWITSAMNESGRGLLTQLAGWIAELLGLEEMENPNSPVKLISKPIVEAFDWTSGQVVMLIQPSNGEVWHGSIMFFAGLALLFGALIFLVANLRGALVHHIETLFRRYFFRNDGIAYCVGAVLTVLVQSSSVTTSFIVPLAGAGAVKLNRIYPYTLGANLGTTVTGVIAATANPVLAGLTVALVHVCFNLIGTMIWYPLRRVPIGIARWYGKLASRDRRLAVAFLPIVFIVIPGLGILITELLT